MLKKTVEILKRIICMTAVLCICLTGCSSKKVTHGGGSYGGNGGGGKKNNVTVTSDNKNHGNYTKRVALTFDDGPHVERTPKIVDELSKYGFHATFFVVGNRVDGTEYSGSEAMIYAINAGNEIGIHGYTHAYYYNSCSEEIYKSELSKTAAAIKKYRAGYNVGVMRPIGGAITDERAANCQYSVIIWDVDSEDWKNRYEYGENESNTARAAKVDKIVENVMSGVKDGSIILMHDIYESTYDAAKIIIKRLAEEGYEIVTVSELLGSEMTAGHKYSCKK